MKLSELRATTAMDELICLLNGREVGLVRRSKGRLSFTYVESWRRARGAYPLSVSMPLAAVEHGHGVIEPFLWGLLPDNDHVIRRWATMFQVSPQNVFGLIARVGEDCAGAVQFLTPQRFDDLQAETSPVVEWLTQAQIGERLRLLRSDAAAARAPTDLGQFSLAGAQPKTALLFDGRRWGVPSGRTPTTHILKPTTAELDGHAENEHVCLALARALGLPTTQSEVCRFEDVSTIVVTRYDRVDATTLAAAAAARAAAAAAKAAIAPDAKAVAAFAVAAADAAADAQAMGRFAETTPIYRVHQEDPCQALSVHPTKKYQNEGGPDPGRIVDLLRAHVRGADPKAAQQDVQTFLDALVFNWLIGGTDAHAKNYSMLIGGDGMVRLAPLYDIASIYAYPHIDPLQAKLAMKIGGEYRLRDVTVANWVKLGKAIGGPAADGLQERMQTMAANLPDALSQVLAKARAAGLRHVVLDRLASALPARARRLTRQEM